MQLSRFLFFIVAVLTPVAVIGTTWLYLYPFFHSCAFPQPPNADGPAPFRLLALGDPQLEGDSSLPKVGRPVFPSLEYIVTDVSNAGSLERAWVLIVDAARDVPKDAWKWLKGRRKLMDLWGNDHYLAHIVRSLRWWTEPSHVAVLGDLLGSQWISDEEFQRRADRYWGVVFKGMEKVPDSIMAGAQDKKYGDTLEVLGQDKSWKNRVINIAGNHDIGYAGDIDENRVARFEKAFGKVNWDIMFELPEDWNKTKASPVADEAESSNAEEYKARDGPIPALRLVILNSMNLDTPAYKEDIQRETYDYMNHVISTSRSVWDKTHATILLTHIPLVKKEGVCVDSPYFNFFDSGTGVKEQNMLSDHSSKIILESIFGLSSNYYAEGQGFGRRGIVVNGHDHAGCDVLHYISQPGIPYKCIPDPEPEPATPEPESQTEPEPEPTRKVEPDSDPAPDAPELQASEPDMPINALNSTTDNPSEDSEEPKEPRELQESQETQEAQGAQEPEPEPEPEAPKEPEGPQWQAIRFPPTSNTSTTSQRTCVELGRVPRIREVTLRSMMGEFSGYAGFLSAWFDPSIGKQGEWVMEVNTCGVGIQHFWWAVHVVDFIWLVGLVAGVVSMVVEANAKGAARKTDRKVAGRQEKQKSNSLPDKRNGEMKKS